MMGNRGAPVVALVHRVEHPAQGVLLRLGEDIFQVEYCVLHESGMQDCGQVRGEKENKGIA